MPVAAEIAHALDAPLDVTVVCKIGAPQNRELAVGAVAEGGVRVLSAQTARALGIDDAGMRALIVDGERELAEGLRRFRGSRPAAALTGRTVILVDDGLATGRSAYAAVCSLQRRQAARVILAVPVAAPASVDALRAHVDEVVCAQTPEDMWAVGLWYEDFRPPADEELAALLLGR
jgi:putative phosphoribosyl transferase